MNQCVQCHSDMDKYGNAGHKQILGKRDQEIGIKTLDIFVCIKPECPSYNLLQGSIENANNYL